MRKNPLFIKGGTPMRWSVSILLLPAVLCFILLASVPLFAQEWSPAQKEIWKNVETYWALGAKNDLEGMLAYYHPDYRGWNYVSGLPSDKAAVKKFSEYDMKTSTVLVYDIRPAAIVVYGTSAFVDYYYFMIYKDAEGKEKSERGRWTDILIKQGDKWMMIGDHGGQTPKN
jgi:ketosteroid isomerase-like protein